MKSRRFKNTTINFLWLWPENQNVFSNSRQRGLGTCGGEITGRNWCPDCGLALALTSVCGRVSHFHLLLFNKGVESLRTRFGRAKHPDASAWQVHIFKTLPRRVVEKLNAASAIQWLASLGDLARDTCTTSLGDLVRDTGSDMTIFSLCHSRPLWGEVSRYSRGGAPHQNYLAMKELSVHMRPTASTATRNLHPWNRRNSRRDVIVKQDQSVSINHHIAPKTLQTQQIH